MNNYKSHSTHANGNIRRREQHKSSPVKTVLLVAGTAAAMGLSVTPVKGAATLWISAPTWSYSAAAAESPVGWAYFWGLSAGVGSYSFAYAFSDDGLGDAAYAFAEASAGNGGQGAVQVGGLADPYAGIGINIPPVDPSSPSGYPQSKPGTDPFSTDYTISPTGITFNGNGSGSELNGENQLQAFIYNGSDSMAGLEAQLGVSSGDGTNAAGSVTSLSALTSQFGLIPLNNPTNDPSSINSLAFTENTGDINTNFSNVILVGMSQAQSTPEPGAAGLLSIGLAGLLIFRKRKAASRA